MTHVDSGEAVSELALRIHLDPLGGIAGDMFAAAMVDTFPQLEAGVLAAVATLPTPRGAVVRFVAHRDGALGGRRFVVTDPVGDAAAHHHAEHDGPKSLKSGAGAAHTHPHTDYASIRTMLDRAPLEAPVRAHAHAMFHLLAVAEAQVHGIGVNDVAFHEVGAWDSIVDFVAAAQLIHAAGSATFTWAALPLGGGRIRSAHGVLPVPAPATALLMRDMAVVDDGVTGERVTPTGATILRYLKDRGNTAVATPAMVASVTGHGFGTRKLPGMSNVLRCLAFTAAPGAAGGATEERVSVMNFEIDDQTGEDLAVAIDRMRAAPGVLDVMQGAMFGKKGRMCTTVQLQVRPEQVDAVSQLVFTETSTLGLRITESRRRVLPRVAVAGARGGEARVKVAHRPDGVVTAKAEIDDVAAVSGRTARDEARALAEARAIRDVRRDGNGDTRA